MTRSVNKACLLRIVLFLEQFVGVTSSMHSRTRLGAKNALTPMWWYCNTVAVQ